MPYKYGWRVPVDMFLNGHGAQCAVIIAVRTEQIVETAAMRELA